MEWEWTWGIFGMDVPNCAKKIGDRPVQSVSLLVGHHNQGKGLQAGEVAKRVSWRSHDLSQCLEILLAGWGPRDGLLLMLLMIDDWWRWWWRRWWWWWWWWRRRQPPWWQPPSVVTNLPCKLFAVISVSVLEAFYAFSEKRVLTVQPFATQIVAVTEVGNPTKYTPVRQ